MKVGDAILSANSAGQPAGELGRVSVLQSWREPFFALKAFNWLDEALPCLRRLIITQSWLFEMFISAKKYFTATSWLVFGQTTGHHILTKLIHNIYHQRMCWVLTSPALCVIVQTGYDYAQICITWVHPDLLAGSADGGHPGGVRFQPLWKVPLQGSVQQRSCLTCARVSLRHSRSGRWWPTWPTWGDKANAFLRRGTSCHNYWSHIRDSLDVHFLKDFLGSF